MYKYDLNIHILQSTCKFQQNYFRTYYSVQNWLVNETFEFILVKRG